MGNERSFRICTRKDYVVREFFSHSSSKFPLILNWFLLGCFRLAPWAVSSGVCLCFPEWRSVATCGCGALEMWLMWPRDWAFRLFHCNDFRVNGCLLGRVHPREADAVSRVCWVQFPPARGLCGHLYFSLHGWLFNIRLLLFWHLNAGEKPLSPGSVCR